MKWLDWLERRMDFIVIPQFPLFIAAANGICYLMMQAQPAFVERLLLNPLAVQAGEWWRVFTFLFVPPEMNPIFLVFWLLLLYQFAQALENSWGEFRFFFFYLFGAAVTVLASLFIVGGRLDNAFLNTTLFLAFATLFPEYELLLFFFIPVKVKYFAYFTWLVTVLFFITGSFATKIGIGASLVNYFLFFGPGIVRGLWLRWEVYRNRRRFRG